MKIVLFTNKNKDSELSVTARASEILREAGIESALYLGDPAVFEDAYAALSFGGDGTFLRCAKLAVRYGAAVLGVHMGHTGFLCRSNPDRLEELRGIASFGFTDRALLEVRLAGHEDALAVNDAVFHRGGIAQTVSLDIKVDGSSIGSFMGDGTIVSTATGSTGYSFSAGGPVIDPALPVMLVTPVCAHASRGHSFVLTPGRVLTVTPSFTEHRKVYCSIDGKEPVLLKGAAEIRISKSVMRYLEPPGSGFFDTVRIHRI